MGAKAISSGNVIIFRLIVRIISNTLPKYSQNAENIHSEKQEKMYIKYDS
jgi:hypothetical protein